MKNLIIPLILMSSLASAGVPHTFKADQPAVAAHVNENFTHLDNRINTSNTAIESVQTDTDELQGKMDTVETAIDGIDTAITTIEDDIATMQSTVSGLESAVADLETTTSASADNITAIENNITTLQSDISSVEDVLSSVVDDVSSLQSENTQLNSNIQSVNNALNLTIDAVDDLGERVVTLENQSQESNCYAGDYGHSKTPMDLFTYSYQPALPGDIIGPDSGESVLRIVKFPLKDFKTGKVYVITFPLLIGYDNGALSVFYDSNLCFDDFRISGYRAIIDIYKHVEISPYHTYQQSLRFMYFSSIFAGGVSIEIGSMLVRFPIPHVHQYQSNLSSESSFDISEEEIMQDFNVDEDFISKVNQAISYIKIEEVTP